MFRGTIIISAAVGFACWSVPDACAQYPSYRPPLVVVRDGELHVDVAGPRPLFQTIKELEELCGCPITYEQPPLEHPSDLVEISPPPPIAGPRAWLPRKGALAFSYRLRGADLRSDLHGGIRALLRAHEDAGLPGRFQVEEEGAFLHVVPTHARSKTGELVAVRSVLDVSIIFAEREGPAIDGIETILAHVRAASGVSIPLTFGGLANLMFRHRIRVGADNEPARTVLGRALASFPTPMSWAVGYDVNTRRYTIGVYAIRPRREAP